MTNRDTVLEIVESSISAQEILRGIIPGPIFPNSKIAINAAISHIALIQARCAEILRVIDGSEA